MVNPKVKIVNSQHFFILSKAENMYTFTIVFVWAQLTQLPKIVVKYKTEIKRLFIAEKYSFPIGSNYTQ